MLKYVQIFPSKNPLLYNNTMYKYMYSYNTYINIHIRFHLGGWGGICPPRLLKVNTLYTPLPPLHFGNSVCPPSHIFRRQHCTCTYIKKEKYVRTRTITYRMGTNFRGCLIFAFFAVSVFLSGFGPRGGKTAICNLVGGPWVSQHANLPVPRGGESEPRGANAPPRPPLKETLGVVLNL